jgi:secreted PhoX family phosphatase
MSMNVSRRSLIRGAAAVSAGALGPFAGFAARGVANPAGQPSLGPISDLRDGEVRLWLPDGFQYRSFHDTETPVVLDDGTALPGRHDGMGAFRAANGNVILIRNHEMPFHGPAFGPSSTVYDPGAAAGTTSIEVTARGDVVRSWTSLSGTQCNCSGGILPWGSWVSCEETVNGPDVGPDYSGAPNIEFRERHGFIFEVPARGTATAEPITAAGRFSHESVAYDPASGILYLTEDNFGYASGFYRYVPKRRPHLDRGRLTDGGRLQALAVKGHPNANLAAEVQPGTVYEATWVDIDDPAPAFPYTPGEEAPTSNDEALCYVSNQGRDRGAAWFSRLEGAVFDNGVVYFTSTQGGGPAEEKVGPITDGFGNGFGQIWAYHVREQKLRLAYHSPGAETLDYPDNVTVSPRGTLIVCEDHNNDNYLRGLTKDGRLVSIALNRIVGKTGNPRHNDEFAGSTFSPDGRTLFVNIQSEFGMSFAIWGPWGRIGI